MALEVSNNTSASNINKVMTIANGETTSDAFVMSGRSVVKLHIPTITSASLSFLVQVGAGDDFTVLKDQSQDTVTIATSTGAFTTTVPQLAGYFAFKIVSSGAQGAERLINASASGFNPTATPTDVEVTIEGATTVTANQGTAGSERWLVNPNGSGFGSPVTVTRPANTTPYTANDVVGGAIDLGVVGPSAGQILIQSSRLEPHIAAVPSGMSYFTLYLYSVTPPSAIADNGAWTLASGDLSAYLGYVNLGTPTLPAASSASLVVEVTNIGKQVLLAGTHLFAYLVTAGGYTPANNSEDYVVGLNTGGL